MMQFSWPEGELGSAAALQEQRPDEDQIPRTPVLRERLRRAVREYARRVRMTPPLALRELRGHAQHVAEQQGHHGAPAYQDYISVLIHNECWREQLAATPYERRLLLLPGHGSVEASRAGGTGPPHATGERHGPVDPQQLAEEARRLGYQVQYAHRAEQVTRIVQARGIQAVIGVHHLPVLKWALRWMESTAMPGAAIPLLRDGQEQDEATVDAPRLREVIHLSSNRSTNRLDLRAMHQRVNDWFAPAALREALGEPEGRTQWIGRQWLVRSGKRWRPFLAVCAAQALRAGPPDGATSSAEWDARKVALAVECFHKASLIHDDIEDEDELRYAQRTVHAEHGVPVALNVGDWLLGEGYRLLSECEAAAHLKAGMLQVAAHGHRSLCAGQGDELCWARSPAPMSSEQVLDIFRRKTGPAFEVALRLGALCAGADDRETHAVLRRYSEALGIAYQIRDDFEDWLHSDGTSDVEAMRPSLMLAVAYEHAEDARKPLFEGLWRRRPPEGDIQRRVRKALVEAGVDQRVRELFERYREEAVRSLQPLSSPLLKGLLRRVMSRIFHEGSALGAGDAAAEPSAEGQADEQADAPTRSESAA